MKGTKPKPRSAPTAVLIEAYNEANPDDQLPTSLQRQVRKRRYRRKIDLASLDGCIREGSRVYRDLDEGRIGLETAEVRSRIISRQRDVVNDRDRKKQIVDLIEQLRELRGGGALAFDPELLD